MLDEPLAHSSIIGGSTAARRIACPASYRQEQRVPIDDTPSPYALEGSACHALIERVIRDDMACAGTSLLPFIYAETRGGVDASFTVDREVYNDLVLPAIKMFDTFLDEMEEAGGEPAIRVEERVAFPGVPGAFGTADILARNDVGTLVWDWKFGMQPVSADGNKQLMFYAVAAMHTRPEMFGPEGAKGFNAPDDWPVTLAICQPRANAHIPATWQTTVAELKKFRWVVTSAVSRATGLEPGDPVEGPHCAFAPCRIVCPLHVQRAHNLAKAIEAHHGGGTEPTKFERLTADEMGLLLELAHGIEPWVKAVLDSGRQMAVEGSEIPGYALVEGRRSYAWRDEKEAYEFLKAQPRLKIDEVAPRKVISPAQARKLDLPARAATRLENIIESKRAAARLVRDDSQLDKLQTTAGALSKLAAKVVQKIGLAKAEDEE